MMGFFYCFSRLHANIADVSSPAPKTSLERRLNQKSKELQDLREKIKDTDHRNAILASENELNRSKVKDLENRLKATENERNILERDIAHYMSENKVTTVNLILSK